MSSCVGNGDRLGIVRARKSAAESLCRAICSLGSEFSESALADRWIYELSRSNELYHFGWYQPPPDGVSVLVGTPPDFSRLMFQSLRAIENWPRTDISYAEGSIIYPYFSVIDRATRMIGDFVGTFYRGTDQSIRDWIRAGYKCTKSIAEHAATGMTYSELFSFAGNALKTIGAKNNNFSVAAGGAADIGHTVPFFGLPSECRESGVFLDDPASLSQSISRARQFVSFGNKTVMRAPCAFTVEMQIVANGMPMVGFHMIVVMTDEGKSIVEEYTQVFSLFGMTDWIY